jgi:serine/threonine/tyrosine-interacting protein
MDAIPAPDWRYEMRREAQEIVPGLFVGPFQSSKSFETLQRLGITDILCITDAREACVRAPDRE